MIDKALLPRQTRQVLSSLSISSPKYRSNPACLHKHWAGVSLSLCVSVKYLLKFDLESFKEESWSHRLSLRAWSENTDCFQL